MQEAVIVSTARTPIGKAYRGLFNATPGPSLGAHAVRAAVERSGVDPAQVDDVIMGSALQQGNQALNIARNVALTAGLPSSVSGMSIDRQCSSGMMAVAAAARQVIVDGAKVVVGGGLDSISTVQDAGFRIEPDPALLGIDAAAYMPMIDTAEVVAERYGISREACDEYALQSQERTAAAQEAGLFDEEIIEGTAPGALEGLAPPDAIFIGGGLTADVFEAAWSALRPLGRLVANAVTLESDALMLDLYKKHGGQLVKLGVQRADAVGRLTAFRPLMPVTQWSLIKR